jgi:putative ABC transport system permease protein
MFSNYIKIAFRNLRRERVNSFINILGLAVGFASCIFIFLFVRSELTYDHFHERGDRIYRLVHDEREFIVPGGRLLATTGPPVGPALANNFPEVLNAVRVRFTDRHIISYNEKRFYEENIVYIDSTLFEVFNFPLQTGNPETALNAPNKVAITSKMAEKYFADEDPIGKILHLDGVMELTVTGVFKPIPQNSHLKFDFAISFATFTVPRGYPVTLDSWGWISFHNYLLLDKDVDPAALEAKFPDFISTHWDPERAKRFKWRLQPLKDIYLGEVLNSDISSGNISYVYGLSGIGILILLMGSFNFMNLSIARSITRSKEVGIRKVLGAFRSGLMKQFLGESIIISLLGFILAFALFEIFGEVLSDALQISLPVHPDDYWALILLFPGISIVVGIISGSYPALVVSHFQPSKVLKGNSQPLSSGVLLRKILVVSNEVNPHQRTGFQQRRSSHPPRSPRPFRCSICFDQEQTPAESPRCGY